MRRRRTEMRCANQAETSVAKTSEAEDVQRGGLLRWSDEGYLGFLMEGVLDDIAERQVEDRRADAEHQDEGDEQLGEDFACHRENQRVACSVQRVAEKLVAMKRLAKVRPAMKRSAKIRSAKKRSAGITFCSGRRRRRRTCRG
jgi:hypothetical protein